MEATVWASLSCWFTPAVLFVVLNLVVGTIAVMSRSAAAADGTAWAAEPADNSPPDALPRVPSALQRLVSFNFGPRGHHSPDSTSEDTQVGPHDSPPIARQPSFLERVRSIRLHRQPSSVGDAAATPSSGSDGDQHLRTSEASSSARPSLLRQMSSLGGLHCRDGNPREGEQCGDVDGDEEVDARADDFINRFKQQLRLQRLESILRYTEMRKRGI